MRETELSYDDGRLGRREFLGLGAAVAGTAFSVPRAARPTSLHPPLTSTAGTASATSSPCAGPPPLRFVPARRPPTTGPRGDPAAPRRAGREPGRVPSRQRGVTRARRSRSRGEVPENVTGRDRADRQHDDGSRADVPRAAPASRRRDRHDGARLLRHPRLAPGGGGEERRRDPLRPPLRRPGPGDARADRRLGRSRVEPANAVPCDHVGPLVNGGEAPAWRDRRRRACGEPEQARAGTCVALRRRRACVRRRGGVAGRARLRPVRDGLPQVALRRPGTGLLWGRSAASRRSSRRSNLRRPGLRGVAGR